MVAVFVPTTAGVPSSLLTIAAWQVIPPSSVTMAATFRIAGTMSGLVIRVTRISPSFTAPVSFDIPDDRPLYRSRYPVPLPGPVRRIFASLFCPDIPFASFFPMVVIGPGLEDIDRPGNNAPFNVLWNPVMVLGDLAVHGKLCHFGIR